MGGITGDESSYCHRCGAHAGANFDPLFCSICFDGVADAARAEQLVVASRGGNRSATIMVSSIRDARAREWLQRGVQVGPTATRLASLLALSCLADPRDIGDVIALLDDPDDQVRRAAIDAAVRVAGPEAADHLAAMLHGDLATYAAMGLARLGDERAVPTLRRVVTTNANGNPYRSPAIALSLVGAAGEHALVEALTEVLDRAESAGGKVIVHVVQAIGGPLKASRSPAAAAVLARARDVTNCSYLFQNAPWSPDPRAPLEPPEPGAAFPARIEVLREIADPTAAGTRFGGQPRWLATPAWPLTRAGTPMAFVAQFDVPNDARMAYLFLDPDGEQTWDSRQGDAAVIVQPGVMPGDVPTRPLSTGPMLARPGAAQTSTSPMPRPFVVRVPDEARTAPAPGLDPWYQFGGSPVWLQGPRWPEGHGWTFVAQFPADNGARELGDGAICYVFVNDDGRGRFLWQCH